MLATLITAVGVFLITVLILRILIPKLKSMKMGQKILDIGPRWHKSKEGTPTMGGLSFLVSVTTAVIVYTLSYQFRNGSLRPLIPFLLTYVMALLNGLIGIFDDRVKLLRKQNEGLKAWQKYLLQVLVAAAYLISMRLSGFLTTELYFPFLGATVDLGWFYYLIAMLLLTGIVNSANLTDGIDGLVSSVSGIIFLFFAVIALLFAGNGEPSAVLAGAGFGGVCGFLVYNFHPARVFMGDTGSLFLGGLCIGLAFLLDNPLIILLAGLIFLIEAFSDILQVGYYKLTHKRIFKMAPIHHHFEKCGWGEIKIVVVFSLITLLACTLSYLSYCL